ncbi:MAG: TonB-dependent receptor plug domain-containing protein, partial [Betaproteobacteria bacterium]|nr:TonB-dependent receptor plug domain-containing protein [Betaproteobacteria bacterium]
MKMRTLSLTLASAGLASLVIHASAQTPPTQKVEKIEVTGSNIKRVDAETASPITVITREDIERSGKPSIAEVLRDVPQNGGQSYNETFTNSFAPGAAGIALRGLSQKATLVLVNGRRMASYGFAQNLFDTFVDLNSIP